jgi:transcriptional regulator with XRE-family HTH domain
MTGTELRFLRKVAELSPVAFAEKLGVTFHTIITWEQSETLRGPNDLAARTVVAAVSFGEDVCVELFKLHKAIQKRDPRSSEISAQWLQAEGRWTVTSAGAKSAREEK